MQIYAGVEALKSPFSASVVSLGNFDGLHLGHRALIRNTIQHARHLGVPSLVFTFSPHPLQILAPERGFLPLFTREDLSEQLAIEGVDGVIFQTFNASFALVSAEKFMSEFLHRPLHPRMICVGPDFAFGRGRSGGTRELAQFGAIHGFQLEVVEPVHLDGERVSSSRVRSALMAGDVASAHRLLGRAYYVGGVVEAGAGRGRGLGFPTANLIPGGVATPRRGVYITRAWLGGKPHPAVTNVGGAPTFKDQPEHARVETHILDQKLELNGVQLRVEFLSYLREERRFASVEELVAQISADVARARAYWQNVK